jgi:hypothetical protein
MVGIVKTQSVRPKAIRDILKARSRASYVLCQRFYPYNRISLPNLPMNRVSSMDSTVGLPRLGLGDKYFQSSRSSRNIGVSSLRTEVPRRFDIQTVTRVEIIGRLPFQATAWTPDAPGSIQNLCIYKSMNRRLSMAPFRLHN